MRSLRRRPSPSLTIDEIHRRRRLVSAPRQDDAGASIRRKAGDRTASRRRAAAAADRIYARVTATAQALPATFTASGERRPAALCDAGDWSPTCARSRHRSRSTARRPRGRSPRPAHPRGRSVRLSSCRARRGERRRARGVVGELLARAGAVGLCGARGTTRRALRASCRARAFCIRRTLSIRSVHLEPRSCALRRHPSSLRRSAPQLRDLQCTSVSDLLEVAILLKEVDASATLAVNIIPLFETIDLERAATISRRICAAFHRRWLDGCSGNQGDVAIGQQGRRCPVTGRCTARSRARRCVPRHGVKLRLFHGRGNRRSRRGPTSRRSSRNPRGVTADARDRAGRDHRQ